MSGARLDPEVQPFQGPGAQQNEITGLAEHHVVAGALAGDIDEGGAGPALEDGPIGLPKPPLAVPLDAQRLQLFRRHIGGAIGHDLHFALPLPRRSGIQFSGNYVADSAYFSPRTVIVL